MFLQKCLLIIISVFMQCMPIYATKQRYETKDVQDQIEVSRHNEYKDTLQYIVLGAGIVAIGYFSSLYQDSIFSMAMQSFGDTKNEKGQVVIDSKRAIAIMNKNKSLQNANYGLQGPVVIEGGQIKSGTLIDGSYFTANGVDYVVKN